MLKKLSLLFFIFFSSLSLNNCASSSLNPLSASLTRPGPGIESNSTASASLPTAPLWQEDTSQIWLKLVHTPLPTVQTTLTQATDPTVIAWLKLAIMNKQYSLDTPELIRQLIHWRQTYPQHPGNALFPNDSLLTQLLNTPAPKKIALLLPLQGRFASQGIAVRDGFLAAYYDALTKTHAQQTLSFYDTNQNLPISALYQQAQDQGADIIMGPLLKENVQELSRQGNPPIPTLTLNYVESWFGFSEANFYQFGLSPFDEALQVADKAYQAGYSHALIIAPQTEWGQRVSKALTQRWELLGGKISDRYDVTPQSDLNLDIAHLMHINPQEDQLKMQEDNDKQTLAQQRRQDFDVIFLLVPPETAREIIPLLKYYYADTIPIYSTSIIYSGIPSPIKDMDLNGVIFCDIPWILNLANTSSVKSKDKFNRLYAVGQDAYLLSSNLARLKLLPNFPLYAETGALTLNSQQQIYRQLPWVKMRNGRV